MTYVPPYIQRAVDEAMNVARENDLDVREALMKVKPYVGELQESSFRTGAEVYEYLFDQIGIDYAEVDESAYGAMVDMLSSSEFSRLQKLAGDKKMASDSSIRKGFESRWPTAQKLRQW